MLYNILTIGDIHWGAMDSKLMYDNLEFFIKFIEAMKGKIDLVVICGDYYDYRLQLSSKTAIYAVKWFDRFVKACIYAEVKKIRVFKGTKDHDNDQLEIFRSAYETDDGYIKIFNTSIVEETLPNLKCLYAPDETMNLRDYHEKYLDLLLEIPDVGFFHGNFDVVLPSIEYDRIQHNNLPTMIYEYEKFSNFIKGALIASHWHSPFNHKSLYYIGSYDSWKFGEEGEKGFIYFNYDTEDNSYQINRIVNPFAREFITLSYTNDVCYTPKHFSEIQETILEYLKKDPNTHIKINYLIVEEREEGLLNFATLQKRYSSVPNIKIETKDLIKKALKKKKKEEVLFEASKYSYIFDNPTDISSNIMKFIFEKKGVELDTKIIDKYISKYL